MKLPKPDVGIHASDIETDGLRTSKNNSTPGPTLARAQNAKADLSLEDGLSIFDAPSYTSFDESTVTGSLSSFSSWPTTASESMQSSVATMGLPTDYPFHRKNYSSSTITLEEELEDFEICEHEAKARSLRRCLSLETCSLPSEVGAPSLASASFSSLPTGAPKRNRHRRQRATEIGSVGDLMGKVKSSKEGRRRQNMAMGPVDFHQKVLKVLFEEGSMEELL